MRHLKEFIELFEDAGDIEKTTSLNFSMEDVRGLDSYKSLIELGFKDITPPRSGDGTLRFSHPAFDGMDYLIYATGYIRRQDTTNTGPWRSGSMVTQSITPPGITRYNFSYTDKGGYKREEKEASRSSLLYGQPITKPSDYDIKFEWLKKQLIKKFFKSAGIPTSITDTEVIKRELTKFAKTSPSATMQVKKMFPKIWDEIKSDTGFDTFLGLADLGF